MSTVTQLPDAFIQHIKHTFPDHLDFDAFLQSAVTPLRTSIRINTLKISVEAFCKKAQQWNWTLTPIPWCKAGFWVEREDENTPLGNTIEHLTGWFYIQEASSMLPVSALFQNNTPTMVLDMASAPGSKTTQIASQMGNKGLLIANELSSSRLKALYANVQRCGLTNCVLTNYDANVFGEWLPETFDSILLDAPCSGEGATRKDKFAMENWSMESIHSIAEVQKKLIISAFQALKIGGEMIYSTCTLSTEENQQVCHYLQQQFPDAVEFIPLNDLFDGAQKSTTPEGFLHVYPHIYDTEGFFVAKIRKLTAVETPQIKKRLGKFPFVKVSKKQHAEITHALHTALDIELPIDLQIWSRDSELWLFPEKIEPLLSEMKFSRIGIRLAEQHRKGYKWHHQMVLALATSDSTKSYELTLDEAREWMMGRDIHPNSENTQKQGDIMVHHNKMMLGIGKWVNHRIKNGLPRDLVKDSNLF